MCTFAWIQIRLDKYSYLVQYLKKAFWVHALISVCDLLDVIYSYMHNYVC